MLRPSLPATLLLLALAASCGGPLDDTADETAFDDTEDALASPGTWFELRKDTNRCAFPRCGGFRVSAMGKSSTTCGTGGPRAADCYVATLDLTAIDRESLDLPTRGQSVVVRGRFVKKTVQGVKLLTLTVNEAWIAPDTRSGRGDFYFVNSSGTRMTALKIGTSTKKTISVLDLTNSGGDATARNDAFTAAKTTTGVVIQGTLTTTGSGRSAVHTLTATKHFLLDVNVDAPADDALCGTELRTDLTRATSGLLFPSESDYPFETFSAASTSTTLTNAAFLAAAGLPANTPVETRTLDDQFSWIARNEPGMDPDEAANAARFRELRRTLELHLDDVRVFRTGQVQVKVWILGKTVCGEIAGVTTTSIET